MNKNILKHIVPAFALSLSLGTTSCVGDLDVEPIDPSTKMTADPVAVYNKCYANLIMTGQEGAGDDCDIISNDAGTTSFPRQLFNVNELPTDEAICCWGDEGIAEFNYSQPTASSPMIQMLYNRLYFGISVCNQYLNDPELSGYDATMTAEVRFVRALQYYYLMDTFGNIAFATEVSTENPRQKSRAEVYNWLVGELIEIEPALMEPRAKTSGDRNAYGRADKAAAWLLLSRLYLNAEVYVGKPEWQLAADYAKKVIDSPYKLWENGTATANAYQMLFMGDNGESGASVEAVLPLLQDGITTTTWGGCMFLIASTFKTDETPGRGTTESWAGNRARKQLVQKFFPGDNCPTGTTADILAAAGDDRALLYSKDRKLDIDNTGEFTEGFTVTKFTNIYSNGQPAKNTKFVDCDFFLMRSAEAYLTYAEATARLSGTGYTTDLGAGYINELRERAHATTQDTYSLRQILDEWSREFYFEGRRRIDLIRFGCFGGLSDYNWQWKGGTKNGVNVDKHYEIYPIPTSDLTANSNLKQNPGYPG